MLEHPATPETGDAESVHQDASAPLSGLGTILIEDKCLKCGPLTKDLFISMQNGDGRNLDLSVTCHRCP